MKRIKISRNHGRSYHSWRLVLWMVVVIVLLLSEMTSCLQLPKQVTKPPTVRMKSPPSPWQVAGVYAITPAIPWCTLPVLTDTFRVTQSPDDLLTVLLAKRGFLYMLATIATWYAGWRASSTLPAGQSLDALNREILRGEPSSTYYDESESSKVEESDETVENETKKKEEDAPIFAVLDEMEGVNQNVALALPIFLATALFVSFVLAQGGITWNLPTSAIINNNNNNNNNIDVLEWGSNLSNWAICLLFTATEFRSCTNINTDDQNNGWKVLLSTWIPNMMALVFVVAASQLPLSQSWAFQNSVNMALAVTVTRAIAPFLIEKEEVSRPSIRTVALALTGLAIYDVISVFGTTNLFTVEAAQAIDTISSTTSIISNSITDAVSSTISSFGMNDNNVLSSSTSSIITAASDSSRSVMETVARAKVEGPIWKPGLLEMVLVGRVSDVIGLGDIVFPACLVSWGHSYHNRTYIYATICGYILGSLLTEVGSTLGPQGLPALLFLTPSMLGTISAIALLRGEFDEVWGITSNPEDRQPN